MIKTNKNKLRTGKRSFVTNFKGWLKSNKYSITSADNKISSTEMGKDSIIDVFFISIWFGLIAGIIEGIGFLVFQEFGWLSWYMSLTRVSLEILWISPLFNLTLFGSIGLVLTGLSSFLPRTVSLWMTVFLFSFLTFYNWISMTERVYHNSAILFSIGASIALTRWYCKNKLNILIFWRRSLPWIVASVLLMMIGIQVGIKIIEVRDIKKLPQSSSGSPNILVIVVDTLRADHLSCYGYFRNTSPNIDRVADLGILFENAFSTSSWTPPSHASLLTGYYLYEHGVEWNKDLASHYITLPEVLRTRSYRTAAFSANAQWFCRKLGFGQGFIHFEDNFHSIGDMIGRTLYGRKFLKFWYIRFRRNLPGFHDHPLRRRAPSINRSVLRWINRNKEKPFFVFINYFDTHDPYEPPPPFCDKFSGSINQTDSKNKPDNAISLKMEDDKLIKEINSYDNAVAYIDYYIGQLIKALQDSDFGENTLIILTSDHGESLGEHGMFRHRNALYHELIHVPLIFSKPGQIPTGVRVAQAVSNAALPSTVMELIGEGEERIFPLTSLSKLWATSDTHLDWPYPLSEIAQQPFKELRKLPVYSGSMRSLIDLRYHYIEHKKLGIELYDRKEDPEELDNLSKIQAMQEIIALFRSQLQQKN